MRWKGIQRLLRRCFRDTWRESYQRNCSLCPGGACNRTKVAHHSWMVPLVQAKCQLLLCRQMERDCCRGRPKKARLRTRRRTLARADRAGGPRSGVPTWGLAAPVVWGASNSSNLRKPPSEQCAPTAECCTIETQAITWNCSPFSRIIAEPTAATMARYPLSALRDAPTVAVLQFRPLFRRRAFRMRLAQWLCARTSP
jgi:hypothetical protein